MTGKGGLTTQPTRALRWMIAGHLLWLAALCTLGAWWAVLILRYAERIHELETQMGIIQLGSESQWLGTHRMLLWEGSFFLGFLILSGIAMFLVYWRDARRQKGLQAFFASVTHELRTPLTSIRLQAESLEESLDDGDPESSRRLTDRLLEDTLRLESQVERTLELARVEGGGRVLSQSIRIKPWLERNLKIWADAHLGQIEIRSELSDEVLEADTAALQVIVRNLLENSVRHGNQESITVHVRLEREPNEWVRLTFRDDGKSSDSMPARIGQLFERGSESQGAGVGLYLVKTLMERMGGSAEFVSGGGFEALLRFKGAKR